MNPVHLIRMANQIGAFFDAMPNREQSVKEVAAHIQRTWEPRMRAALIQHTNSHGASELMAIVRDALPLIKEALNKS